MKFTTSALFVAFVQGAYPAIRDLVVVRPPVNSEGTCGARSIWAAWKQTSDCCNGPVKERIYYERTCKNSDCVCYGATTAYGSMPLQLSQQPTLQPSATGQAGLSGKAPSKAARKLLKRSCQTNTNRDCCVGSTSKSRKVPGCDNTGTIWGAWAEWSICVGGVSTRRRDCVSNNPDLCQGYLSIQRNCGNTLKIWGAWSAWSSCYDSKKTRTRPCVADDASICQGILSVVEPCTIVTPVEPAVVFDSSFCTYTNSWSLKWCLNYNIGCYSWFDKNYAQKGLACATRNWRFSQIQIDRIFSIFGVYLTSA
ncbi:unnamed protein product [Oikopleura dioica]|uniref:Uncharacterized protein n=1 Tax=Oikopleura dioica TaxID=34765 RepID=E4YTW7_OIKDI|nr:unnamed protein product [Oikopleura dioica]